GRTLLVHPCDRRGLRAGVPGRCQVLVRVGDDRGADAEHLRVQRVPDVVGDLLHPVLLLPPEPRGGVEDAPRAGRGQRPALHGVGAARGAGHVVADAGDGDRAHGPVTPSTIPPRTRYAGRSATRARPTSARTMARTRRGAVTRTHPGRSLRPTRSRPARTG